MWENERTEERKGCDGLFSDALFQRHGVASIHSVKCQYLIMWGVMKDVHLTLRSQTELIQYIQLETQQLCTNIKSSLLHRLTSYVK